MPGNIDRAKLSDTFNRISDDASNEPIGDSMIWSTDAATLAGISDPTHPWLKNPTWITLPAEPI